jgi:Membrane bound FAD containing D-sorbitol dehydrogenase
MVRPFFGHALPRHGRRLLLVVLIAVSCCSDCSLLRSQAYRVGTAMRLQGPCRSSDQFIELSEKLCAMSIDDRALADAIQNALSDQYSNDELRRIAELVHSASLQDIDRLIAGSGLQKVAASIVSIWYSGLFGTSKNTRVLAYEEALAWRATGYAKAPGTCGEFGDWITKPTSARDRERWP